MYLFFVQTTINERFKQKLFNQVDMVIKYLQTIQKKIVWIGKSIPRANTQPTSLSPRLS